MGDDQANEYIYKFVSAGPWRSLVAQGRSPLDDGTLYVAPGCRWSRADPA